MQLGQRIGQNLEPAGRIEVAQPAQLPEARHDAPVGAGRGRPRREFLAARQVAHEIDAPSLFVPVPETQLGVGDAEFCAPTLVVSRGRDVPHRVPPRVLVGVVEIVGVLLDAGGVYRELEGGAPVEVGIDDHGHQVRIRLLVAPRQLARDLAGAGVECPDVYVESGVPVQHARLGPLCGGFALVRLELGETRGRGGSMPCRFPHGAVKLDVRVGDLRRREDRYLVVLTASRHHQGAAGRPVRALFLSLNLGTPARQNENQCKLDSPPTRLHRHPVSLPDVRFSDVTGLSRLLIICSGSSPASEGRTGSSAGESMPCTRVPEARFRELPTDWYLLPREMRF